MYRIFHADCWRPAASIALVLAVLPGCATRSASVRPPGATDGEAPNLLNVSEIAPSLNVGLARQDAPPRRTRDEASQPPPRQVSPDKAVAPASVPNPTPSQSPGVPDPSPLS